MFKSQKDDHLQNKNDKLFIKIHILREENEISCYILVILTTLVTNELTLICKLGLFIIGRR